MKKSFSMALMLGLATSCVLAEWQTIQRDSTTITQFEVGTVKRVDNGLVMIEFKRMAMQLKPRGLVVVDQFVAACREQPQTLFSLLKIQGSVHVNEGENLRTVSSEKFDPPKEVATSDASASELGSKVCKLPTR